jgi:hypothetical protein
MKRNINRNSRRAIAKALMGLGINVFAIKPGKKEPLSTGWQKEASRTDLKQWDNGRDVNVGVAAGTGLVVIDIDMKNGIDGEANWATLCKKHGIVESDFQIATPNGGRHIYYFYPEELDIRNSVSKIALGVDVRGNGGFVVGPGSILPEGEYTVINKGATIAQASQTLLDLIVRKKIVVAATGISPGDLDKPENLQRAEEFLEAAEASVEGAGGDQNAFAVAARVRDMGVSEGECLDLMLGEWNGRCSPPWSGDDLAVKVENAYKYAGSPQGSDTPEAQFADDPDSEPVTKRPAKPLSTTDQMSQNHALVRMGTSYVIADEYIDDDGRTKLSLATGGTFHVVNASNVWFDDDGKRHVVSKEWIASTDRPTYRGFTFDPRQLGPVSGKYNHWRGFSYNTLDGVSVDAAKNECDLFLKHIRDVVCRGNRAHYKWILNHLAHLVQHPEKKPETAIVVVGEKGAGKSLIFDVIGKLAQENYVLTAEKRMLLGNFNSHMQTVLVFQFEEAFWAGDKEAEGKLKLLITGKQHMIELKGYEPYMVGNYARIYITSNNDWAVPASVDERRFAIFEAISDRIGDKKYFEAIFDQLEAWNGRGYRALMSVLSAISVDKTAVHVAPQTQALADQKMETLECVAKWFHASLKEGCIDGVTSEFDDEDGWVSEALCKDVYDAYCTYAKAQGFRYPKSETSFGRQIRKMVGDVVKRSRKLIGHRQKYVYLFDNLKTCRKSYETWFGHEIEW